MSERITEYIGRGLGVFLLSCCLLGGLGACSGSKLPPLSLTLEQVDSTDSTLYLVYEGLDSVWRDSLPMPVGQALELHPDTARLSALMLCHDGYRRVYRYELHAGVWRSVGLPERQPLPDSLDSTALLGLGGKDARGKDKNLYELLGKGRVAVVFSSLDLGTHSRKERDSLLALYGKDSLCLIYMMLTPSDSAARSRLKRDSLDKQAEAIYTDTLGIVSRMRTSCGISRKPSPHIFIIDSLGQISPYQAK